ncbi:MAG: threonine/serine exporter family protein [Actinobacteria bacterium]|nr:threonine/serine exporter family protein [Actinomycetota bacterium]
MGLSIDEPPPGTGAHSAATQPLARFVARLGLAMIAAGESVAATHDALRTISGAYGVHDASFYTLPTGSVVVLRDADETRIELATEGRQPAPVRSSARAALADSGVPGGQSGP